GVRRDARPPEGAVCHLPVGGPTRDRPRPRHGGRAGTALPRLQCRPRALPRRPLQARERHRVPGVTHPHTALCFCLEPRGAFVYACDMAKNMTGVEMRPTPAGRKALEEGRYEDVAALPSRMKQYRVARRVDGQRIRTPFCATAALAEEDF